MPVVVLTDMPADVEQYDAVAEKINPEQDPPAGMILHSAAAKPGGGMRNVDIWESEDAYNRFRDERLMPAVQEVAGDSMDGPPPPPEIFEIHHLVKP
jgi:hypothetical protein